MKILKNSTIRSAIKILNKFGTKTLVVIDKNNKFKGTLSDGDIRKSLLRGKKLNDKIHSIYNSKPIFFHKKSIPVNLKKIFLKHKIDLIPIVDHNENYFKSYKFIDIFKNAQNFLAKKTNVIIMSGGEGSRLEPFTKVIPKPLMPVGSSTLIEMIITQFTKHGFNRFLITTFYKHEIIEAFCKNLKLKKKIKILREKKPMGTAGSLRLITNVGSENCFVVNCDGVIDINLSSVFHYHEKNNFDLTMVACMKKFNIPYGVCQSSKKGEFEKIIEKPNFEFNVNIGLYLMKTSILKIIPINKKFDMNQLIDLAIKRKLKVGVYTVSSEAWYDLGQKKDYLQFINK